MAQKIMICIDGSEFSNEALKWYSQNFYREGHKCYLVYVPESFVNVSMMSPGKHLECVREAEERTAHVKKQYVELAAKCNVPAEFVAAHGKDDEKTGAVLIRIAKELDPLFIITGTRGMGTIRRTILGSVSDYLVHHSSCPVLVARHKEPHHKGQQQMDQ
ncbi:hypothetical protein KUTeg_021387 [Tegillarca granosa]|uniref:UspA domain-containing protein n=1 Tax=Tegillarca granosa TaxID=220873 RepID=A0ABQ9EG40_TEGGR|nr:hypothetical protein KUTeg_021387 [Tegillarca granosa]